MTNPKILQLICSNKIEMVFCASWFEVSLKVSEIPSEWTASAEKYPVNISYHWKTLEGEVLIWDGLRTALPQNPNGASIEVEVLIHAPNKSGFYKLEISGVREGCCWWEDYGVSVASLDIEVRPLIKGSNIIFFAGGAGFNNAGDEALLRSAAELCVKIAPRANLIVCANSPRVAIKTLEGLQASLVPSLRTAFFRGDEHYGKCDEIYFERWRAIDEALSSKELKEMVNSISDSPTLNFIDRAQAEVFLRSLSAASMLVVHGGGILTSSTRSRLWEMALLCRIAKRLGVKIALRSHQIGPYSNKEDMNLAREMINRADYVSVRDRDESRLTALAAGVTTKVWEDVDDAYLLDYTKKMGAAELVGFYKLLPEEYICACFRMNGSVGVSEKSLDAFISTVEYAAQSSGKIVVLLPMGPFDVDILKIIKSRLNVESQVLIPKNWFGDPAGIAQHAFFVISLPHHPLIFALQKGTPIISPVEGDYYLAKNRGSMRLFGLEHFVINISALNAKQLLRRRVDLLIKHNVLVRSSIQKKARDLEWSMGESRNHFQRLLIDALHKDRESVLNEH